VDLYGGFIEFVRFSLDNLYRIPGAVAQAVAQSVAEIVCREPSLAVDYRNRPLGAGGDAEPAAVTFVFVDLNYFS
jgi:hypothetical protein